MNLKIMIRCLEAMKIDHERSCLFLYLYNCELVFVKPVEYFCHKYILLYEHYEDKQTKK